MSELINTPDSLAEINLEARINPETHIKGYPSPETWRDQILYFLLPDRFSDGQEAHKPIFDRNNPDQYKALDKGSWMSSGTKFQGGTIKGITSKLDYLRELGVTTLWVGPLLKQRMDLQTYHGYTIQDFMNVDPRFGTVDDLIDLISEAHKRGMYVILDIIYNHTGSNWFYKENGNLVDTVDYRFQPPHDFGAWRTEDGKSSNTISSHNDGVWPKEFQNPDWYTRAGKIGNWDSLSGEDHLNKDAEFRRGDFYDLKDLNYDNSEVLKNIIQVYQYWIGLIDCDGFRLDTLKHVPWNVSRMFCNAIHEYAELIGKENFLLVGEVTGGEQMEKSYLDVFGRNIDAILDIGYPALKLKDMVKGFANPAEFFDLYSGHSLLGSHRETGRYHISVSDDHDMVTQEKHRFSAFNNSPNHYYQTAHLIGVQLTSLGIPCIYYGTEQTFDGNTTYHDSTIEPYTGNVPNDDRYIRESMFGGTFGAFGTSGCHFFNPDHPTYIRISAISRIRSRNDKIGLALRRGRQYIQETSFLGRPFSIPGNGELVAWSRILVNQEVLIVLNTNGTENRGAEITVNSSFHEAGSQMNILYRGDWEDDVLKDVNRSEYITVPVNVSSNGRATIRVDLPPSGMTIIA